MRMIYHKQYKKTAIFENQNEYHVGSTYEGSTYDLKRTSVLGMALNDDSPIL